MHANTTIECPATIKTYRLASAYRGGKGYTLTVRESTWEERCTVDPSRDCMTVVIRSAADRTELTCVIGSPVCGSWDESDAARSAISFASEIAAWDDASERTWVAIHGEALVSAATNHSVLGAELRGD